MISKLELLAPARNLVCGKAAIDHGADAVYIGASRFGARAAAGNSVEDIAELCAYAHQFGALVYVTVNTVIYDDELADTERLLWQLYEADVDAILVQDMAVLGMNLPPVPLHASTQTDNRTADKVRWLRSLGFQRTVLARELSIKEIADIHADVPEMPLEVFVHGALCVSYSGQCYISEHCFGRSGNRGECAQFCRMPFMLKDGDGRTINERCYPLSLRDNCQIEHLGELAAAGATSFKIEGRLKDVDYVKNVVAAYSRALNKICEESEGRFVRQSYGHCHYTFTPDINRTYSRAYTDYFANGKRSTSMLSLFTPKAIGTNVGVVEKVSRDSFTIGNVPEEVTFANGDGFCFFNPKNELEGIRANRVEGCRIFTDKALPNTFRRGVQLYRNLDHAFQQQLQQPDSGERKLWVDICVDDLNVTFTDEVGRTAKIDLEVERQIAQRPQAENIRKQLSKLGNTPFEARSISVPDDYSLFVPSSMLSEARRCLVQMLLKEPLKGEEAFLPSERVEVPVAKYRQPHLYNAVNAKSKEFYLSRDITTLTLAEACSNTGTERSLLMQCRYCLRHALGACLREGGAQKMRPPITITMTDGRMFELVFDCAKCEMNVVTYTNS